MGDHLMSPVDATAEGVEAAEFTRLVEEHAGLVFAAIYAVIPHTEEADDLAQETFLRAWEKRGALRDRGAAASWLYRIARNLAISHLRSRGARRVLNSVEIEELDAVSMAPSPQQAAMDAELGEILHDSLELMPDSYRVPLVLSALEDYSTAQIAALMGVSEDVVRQRLSRGRSVLKRETEARLETARKKRRSGKGMAAAVMASIFSGSTATSAFAVPISVGSGALWLGGGVLATLGLAVWLVMCAGNATNQTGTGGAAASNGAVAPTAARRIAISLSLRDADGSPAVGGKAWFTTNERHALHRADEEGMIVVSLEVRGILMITGASATGITRQFFQPEELARSQSITMRLEDASNWVEPPLPDGFSWPETE